MRYTQHIRGNWPDLKGWLKDKFPSLTEKDLNIDVKDHESIMVLAGKLLLTCQQLIWIVNKL